MAKAKANGEVARSERRAGAPPPAGAGRQQDLLDAAYAVIAEKGLEGLRTRDIAARAGVNISTLHYYYGTKEALLVAVLEHVIARFRDRPQQGRPETLREHLEEAARTFQEHPQLWIVLQELLLRARRDPGTRQAFRAVHRGWRAEVERIVAAEVEAGRARAEVDPRTSAAAITSMIIGAMTQLEVDAKAIDFRDLVRELEVWLAPPVRRASRRG